MAVTEPNWGYLGFWVQVAFGLLGLGIGALLGALTRSWPLVLSLLLVPGLLYGAWAVQARAGIDDEGAFAALFLAMATTPLGCWLGHRRRRSRGKARDHTGT